MREAIESVLQKGNEPEALLRGAAGGDFSFLSLLLGFRDSHANGLPNFFRDGAVASPGDSADAVGIGAAWLVGLVASLGRVEGERTNAGATFSEGKSAIQSQDSAMLEPW